MAVLFAYISVVLIWATTPLAIQWSSDSITFIAAAVARMSIALVLALSFLVILRKSFLTFWQHRWIYFAASISVFPNMPVVYWAAQFIPSGLIAVIFSLSPFVTGVMTLLLLKQNPFSIKKIIALLLALLGLVIIFYHQIHFDFRSVYGISGIFLSCFLFSFSSVWVKKITAQQSIAVDAFHQAVGSLLFSLPGLLLCWWLMDGNIPQHVSTKSVGAIVYLAIIGSLVGSALFFYILQRLSASVVSLITLMTPVLAILLGKNLANEELSPQTLLGVALVLIALIFYSSFSFAAVLRWCSQRSQKWLRQGADCVAESSETSLQKARDDMIRFK
ncbi:MAG TPA: DMT family transporter [Cellvibrio sp.]|nr:DMT family transporter [Cellvibrio sp.]